MRRLFFAVTVIVLAAGCGYYGVSGSLPSHIKTCAVPLFENETVETGIVEEITSQVVDAIVRDGTMKVVGEFQADAVLYGTVVDVVESPESFEGQTAQSFRIRIFVDVTFYDRRKNTPLWEEPNVMGEAVFSADDLGARHDAIQAALQMLAREIVDLTVSGW